MLNTIINIKMRFRREGEAAGFLQLFHSGAGILWRRSPRFLKERELPKTMSAEISPAESLKRTFERAAQALPPDKSNRRRTGLHPILGNGSSMQNAGIIR